MHRQTWAVVLAALSVAGCDEQQVPPPRPPKPDFFAWRDGAPQRCCSTLPKCGPLSEPFKPDSGVLMVCESCRCAGCRDPWLECRCVNYLDCVPKQKDMQVDWWP